VVVICYIQKQQTQQKQQKQQNHQEKQIQENTVFVRIYQTKSSSQQMLVIYFDEKR